MNRGLWLSVLWFAGMMYALLLHQGSNAPLPFAHFDKVVHAALFFGQFWLLAKVFLLRRQPVPWQALLLAALVLAAGSEWAQGALTARVGRKAGDQGDSRDPGNCETIRHTSGPSPWEPRYVPSNATMAR